MTGHSIFGDKEAVAKSIADQFFWVKGQTYDGPTCPHTGMDITLLPNWLRPLQIEFNQKNQEALQRAGFLSGSPEEIVAKFDPRITKLLDHLNLFVVPQDYSAYHTSRPCPHCK